MSLGDTLEQIFRRTSPALVASLTRAIGPSRLDVVESVVQEAFLRAMADWTGGIPENAAGWLHAVARNLAIDHLRRERTFRTKEDAIARYVEAAAAPAEDAAVVALRGELADDQLAMIFVACHPCNSAASQIALSLRTLCGLEVPAIARALFATEDAIEKRLVLARRRIRENGVSFDLPSAEAIGARLDAVLRVLYLLFNEGYSGTTGPDVVQEDVAAEAIRLATFLAQHPATRRPRVVALLALMHFHASRFPARTDAAGDLVTLAHQDRSAWDARHVALGLHCLAESAEGESASPYHYEAAIAAVHATSPSHDATDWAKIVGFYDDLTSLYPSPGARLSRAIAVGFRDGPARGLAELALLESDPVLAGLAAFHAARGDAHARRGHRAEALDALRRAHALSANTRERRYFARKMAEVEGGGDPRLP